jgi:hypothetical protein
MQKTVRIHRFSRLADTGQVLIVNLLFILLSLCSVLRKAHISRFILQLGPVREQILIQINVPIALLLYLDLKALFRHLFMRKHSIFRCYLCLLYFKLIRIVPSRILISQVHIWILMYTYWILILTFFFKLISNFCRK